MDYIFWLLILAAPAASLALAVNGTWGYGWPLYSALAAQAAGALGLASRRRYFGAAAAVLAIALHAMIYGSAYDVGRKSAHYENSHALNALRDRVELHRAARGAWPEDLSGLDVPVLAVKNGHRRTTRVDPVGFPPEAYTLSVPAEGEWREVTGSARGRGGEVIEFRYAPEPPGYRRFALLPPGEEYEYSLYGVRDTAPDREPPQLLSSGTVRVPGVPGYDSDTGAWGYDPGRGHVFINCSHKPEYKDGLEWRRI